MKRTGRTDRSLILLIIIVMIVLGAGVYAYFQFQTDAMTVKLKEREPIVILFLVSEEEELVFLDLLLYHPKTKRGSLFYIPANLGTKLESLDRFDKIDVLYDPSDLSGIRDKVEQITELDVSFYWDMSLENLRSLVDLVGGVELFISNPVDIKASGNWVLLPSGSVLLDGDKVVDYMSYEQSQEEDREIVGRKQKILAALMKKLGDPAIGAMLMEKEPFGYLRKQLNTNMSPRAIQAFIAELGKLESDRLLFQRVLGKTEVIEGVEGELLFPHYEGNLIRQTINQSWENLASEETEADDSATVTIEILNGTNIDGLAKRTKALYESFGFDVVSFRNADNDQYLNTIVLDRRGKSYAVEKTAEVIKCQRIYTRLDADLNLDITLILGRDFDGRYCK